MEQPITSTTTKGVVITLIMIVLSLIAIFTKEQNGGPITWASLGIFFIGVIVSVSIFGKQSHHVPGFGTYFAHGFKVSAVVAALMIVFMVIMLITFPEIKQDALDAQRQALDNMDQLTQQQKEQSVELTRKFFMAFTIGGTLFQYIFVGAIAALLGAAFTKKKQIPQDAYSPTTLDH